MDELTIVRGPDGFGSQFFAIISGIGYAKKHGIKYTHSMLESIKLNDVYSSQNINEELEVANSLINSIITKLGFELKNQSSNAEIWPYMYDEIVKDVSSYYNEDFLKFMQSGYVKEQPSYYLNDKMNIAIHIRRGGDVPETDRMYRIIENKVYENLISLLLKKYDNAKIHIFSWTNPNLNIESKNIEYHIADSPNNFIEDFNALVHSDILVTGSSTFSLSAGFFNKNIVVSDKDLCKLNVTPIPPSWIENYKQVFNIID